MRKKTDIAIVKSKRAHGASPTNSTAQTAESGLEAVESSFKTVAIALEAAEAMGKTLTTVRILPPGAACGERVKALARGRYIIGQLRPLLANLRQTSVDLDVCLNEYEGLIAREQAEVDALLTAGAEIDEAEDEDED